MRSKNVRKKYKVLGVSAGQGALLYPFKDRLIANIEPRGVFHTPKEEQWNMNFRGIPFLRGGLPEEFKPDVILSSPDCGASSIMRLSKVKVLGNPIKNPSLELVIEAISFYKPKVFLIENLPRLLSLVPLEYFENVFRDYNLIVHTSSVSEFGNSQISRKRLMLIGVHKTKASLLKNRFNTKFLVNQVKNTRKLLNKPYRFGNWTPSKYSKMAMYDYRKLPEKRNLTVRRIHKLWTTDFKGEKKWPIKTSKMKTLPGVYRLEADKPPLTVRPADRQFRPDGWPLGILDIKNIMGFPDDFRVYMDGSRYKYWLNKGRYTLAKGAVYEIGLWFKACLESD